jgi:hypothetical protein
MALHLVIHRPPGAPGSAEAAATRAALSDTVWEVADTHWSATDEALVVSTDLSAAYLLEHFRAGLERRGQDDPGLLLITPMAADTAWSGLRPEAAAWLRDLL